MVSARRGSGTQRANPGAPAAQSPCLPVPRGPSTQWAITGAPDAFCGTTSARRGSGTQRANPGAPAAQRHCSFAPSGSSTQWATVERNGGPSKGRSPQQNRVRQNQGQRRGHSAAPSNRNTVQARTPPTSTMKRTVPATNKERALRTRDGVGERMWWTAETTQRSRAPGPHAHGNAARQIVDGLRTKVWGQQKQSNDPRNSQHNPKTPTTGRR